MVNSYLVWGKNGGILGVVYGYNKTNAEFTAFRNFGIQFDFVQLANSEALYNFQEKF